MTPARRAALEKAQAASARKRRKGIKSRTARLTTRKTLAVVAVGGFAAHKISAQKAENDFVADPMNDLIINRHVETARYHNWRLNELRALGIPPQLTRVFDEKAARREAIAILRKKKKKS
ncbi:hypothetical protein [Mycolicibacterium mageritense]